MAGTVEYLVERRIILTRVTGELSHEDAGLINQAHTDLIRCGVGKIHVIFDLTHLKAIKLNVRELFELMSFRREPQLGWVCVVGGPAAVKFTGRMVLGAAGVNLHFVREIGEARAFLENALDELAVH